jgi:hypothetical protein
MRSMLRPVSLAKICVPARDNYWAAPTAIQARTASGTELKARSTLPSVGIIGKKPVPSISGAGR